MIFQLQHYAALYSSKKKPRLEVGFEPWRLFPAMPA
jgi:hypothetical protein